MFDYTYIGYVKASYCLILCLLLKPGFPQIVPPAVEDNSVVYFLRGAMGDNFRPRTVYPENFLSEPLLDWNGAVTNTKEFCLYDEEKYIGKLCNKSYIRHECKAGKHLFWSYTTFQFVEAELAAGKVYFIDVTEAGGKSSGDLRPVYPDNELLVEGMLDFISSRSARVVTDDEIQTMKSKKKCKKVEKALYRYEDYRLKGKLPAKLTRDMYYRPLK